MLASDGAGPQDEQELASTTPETVPTIRSGHGKTYSGHGKNGLVVGNLPVVVAPAGRGKTEQQRHNSGKFSGKDGLTGWREYRNTGGRFRYAIDRWWTKHSGTWHKKGKNVKGVRMTEDIYVKWKDARAAARERRKVARRGQEIRSAGME